MGLFSSITDAVFDAVDFASDAIQGAGGALENLVETKPAQLAVAQQIKTAIKPTGANMGIFDTFTSGLSSVAQNLTNIANPINTIGGFFGSDQPIVGPRPIQIQPPSVIQQPAQAVQQAVPAQETGSSGSLTLNVGQPMQTQQAGFGALLPGLISGGRALLKSPIGQAIGIGGAGALIGSMGGTSVSKQKFRTKDVRLAKSVLKATNNNLQMASQILRVDPFTLLQMSTQKLPEKSVVPTTSAIRKTRKTVRQLERLVNLRDDIAKMAKTTTRRRTTTRKSGMSTTLIKN